MSSDCKVASQSEITWEDVRPVVAGKLFETNIDDNELPWELRADVFCAVCLNKPPRDSRWVDDMYFLSYFVAVMEELFGVKCRNSRFLILFIAE